MTTFRTLAGFAFLVTASLVALSGHGVANAATGLSLDPAFGPPGTIVAVEQSQNCPVQLVHQGSAEAWLDGNPVATGTVGWCPSGQFPVVDLEFSVPMDATPGNLSVNVRLPDGCYDFGSFTTLCNDVTILSFTVQGASAWVSISTDKTSYAIGEMVSICYEVSQPGRVVVTRRIGANSAIVLLDGIDDGTGDCLVGVAGTPAGGRTLTITLYSNLTAPVAQSGTTYAVTATQPPATQPPATQPPATQPPGTQPPATQPPATQPPATQPPSTGDVGRITVPAGPLTEACEYLEDTDNLPAKRAANLVLVTHGWNGPFGSPGGGDDIGLAEPIREYLNDRVGSDEWDVIGLDWSPFAGHPLDHFWGPQVARRNAEVLGSCLGQALNVKGYQYVHLIAHSAGTALIDEVSSHLAGSVQVHLTMLDAYLPISDEARKTFGSSADWIDHYYRQDRSKDCGPTNPFACALGPTDLPLGRACNVDMTELSDQAGYRLSEPHGGPMSFYRWSIESPSGPATTWGFPKSREATGGSPQLCQPGSIQYLKDTTSVNVPPIDLSEQVQKLTPLKGDLFNKTTGTGSFSTTDDGGIQLGSGSPSGVEANVTLAPGANGIAFSYAFTTPGEGVLTFELDGVLMWETRAELGQGNSEFVFFPPAVEAGSHTLKIQLDAPSEAPSQVRIDGLELARLEFGSPPEPPLPPNTGNGESVASSTPWSLPLGFGGVLLVAGVLAVWYGRRTRH